MSSLSFEVKFCLAVYIKWFEDLLIIKNIVYPFVPVCVVVCRVSTIKKFTRDMMDTLRRTVVQDPLHFLLLPRTKQELLVDKIVQRMVGRETVLSSLCYFKMF